MKITITDLALLALLCLVVSGCKKQGTNCSLSASILYTTGPSEPCAATGSITITSPTGPGYQYKIDNEAFGGSPAFRNVGAGRHRILVKDANGCEASKEAIVDTLAAGTRFTQVLQILNNRCARCHSGNNPQAGLNFTNACDVLGNWQRIEARAIYGIPSPMPQSGLIPVSERNVLIDWIAAGHSYTN
jgi:hypothetical protein